MFKDIVQMSYLIIITDITLFLFLMFNSTLSVKRKSKFMICTLLSFIMVICNIIVYSLNDAGGHILLMKIVSAISFSISGTVTLPFIFVTDVLKKQIRRIIECLALFNVVLCITSIFNGCVFRFDSAGNRILGPLAPVPYVFSFIYITVLTQRPRHFTLKAISGTVLIIRVLFILMELVKSLISLLMKGQYSLPIPVICSAVQVQKQLILEMRILQMLRICLICLKEHFYSP